MKKIILGIVMLSLLGCVNIRNEYRSPMYKSPIHVEDSDKIIVLDVGDETLYSQLQDFFYTKGWNVILDNKGKVKAKYQMTIIGHHNMGGTLLLSTINVFDLNTRKLIYTQSIQSDFGGNYTLVTEHKDIIVSKFNEIFK